MKKSRSEPRVSVLFSEPKIPQSYPQRLPRDPRTRRFSALQRAENSSIHCCDAPQTPRARRFSALQRAENSSIPHRGRSRFAPPAVSVLFSEPKIPQSLIDLHRIGQLRRFQCSSASRKFLNCRQRYRRRWRSSCFSALQRAENSSIN